LKESGYSDVQEFGVTPIDNTIRPDWSENAFIKYIVYLNKIKRGSVLEALKLKFVFEEKASQKSSIQ